MNVADHNKSQSEFYATLENSDRHLASTSPWGPGPDVADLDDDETPELGVIYTDPEGGFRVTTDGIGWFYYDDTFEAEADGFTY